MKFHVSHVAGLLCLAVFSPTLLAANGSIAGAMPRDAHRAAQRIEAQLRVQKEACAGALAQAACKPEVKRAVSKT
jgi:hypothetical protein